jgi:hypothetical protein
MPKITIIAACLALPWGLSAASFSLLTPTAGALQGWKNTAHGSLAFSQASVDNWSAGGDSALNWQLSLAGHSAWQNRPWRWDSQLKMDYGQASIGSQPLLKSADSLHFDSVASRQVAEWIAPFVAVTLDTQFAPGYNAATPSAQVSQFMDPAYLTESLGLGHAWGETLRTRLGAAARQTYTNAFPFPYADNPDTAAIEKIRQDYGVSWVSDLNWAFGQNLALASQLDVFSNLRATDQCVVHWVNSLKAAFSPWLAANWGLDLAYDPVVSTRRQLKELFSLALSWTFL